MSISAELKGNDIGFKNGVELSLNILRQMEKEFKDESAVWFGNWDNQKIVLETIKEAINRILEYSKEKTKTKIVVELEQEIIAVRADKETYISLANKRGKDIDEFRELLKKIEWIEGGFYCESSDEDDKECPDCGNFKSEGHDVNCNIAEALK